MFPRQIVYNVVSNKSYKVNADKGGGYKLVFGSCLLKVCDGWYLHWKYLQLVNIYLENIW